MNLTSLGHKDQQERKIGGIGLIKLTMSGQQQRKAKLNNRVGNIKSNLIHSVLLFRLDVVPNLYHHGQSPWSSVFAIGYPR